MSPFPGNAVRSVQQAPVDDDTTARPGPHDDTEHHRGTGGGTVRGFRQGQAIGIIGETQRTTQQVFKILVQRNSSS